MSAVQPQALEQALRAADWQPLRATCLSLTLTAALALGLPVFLSQVAPRPLPLVSQPGNDMDLVWSALFVLQWLLVALVLWLPRSFRRRLASAGSEAAWLAGIKQACLLRYALAEAVCLAGALGLYLAYTQGLLPPALRIWGLAVLPSLALLWMLRHWPDAESLKRDFLSS